MASADSLTVPDVPTLTRAPLARPATGLTPALRERLAACARIADTDGEPDRQALALLRESGLLGLPLPYEYGGAGVDAQGLNTAVEQVAQVNASASIMLFQHYAVSSRILEHGSPAQRRRLLPRLAHGEWLAASAWSETGAGANKKNLSTTARRTADGGWVIDGAKSFTTSAGLADVYLVLAQSEEPAPDAAADTGYGAAGQTFFLIPADTPGLEPDTSLRLTGMRGSATGFVSVHDCRVPDTARLGPVGTAASIIAGVRDSGATLGAVSVGIAQAALDLAHEHAERRGLTAQQAVRHRLVDIAGEVEAARAIVERAGRRTAPDPGIATLHSKLFAASAAERVVNAVERLLGSAGYVASHEINRYGRDARAVALMGPTNDLCKELVSLTWNS
ncbi:acyl-CoA dehydrogenase family protein [Streptomyces sp. NPDC021562]|uniref:acyl-CoA dehydrogenase family protein n=1 Tax=Streptomyces sp. NPDC021562 TaxID=3155121 RepID=UPI0033F9EF5A